MNINIKDYILDDEIKSIIENEIVIAAKRMLSDESEMTRILTNISYKIIWEKIEEEIPEYQTIIKEKTKENLYKITRFDIFKSKDEFFNTKDSLAQKYLNESVEENKNIIDTKVKEIMNNLSLTDIKCDIQNIIEEYFDKILE